MKISPKTLFFIDGIGAASSIVFLGVVFVKFNDLIGIPVSSLYLLASIPVLFALLDLYCYLNKNKQTSTFLRLIALLNLAYCVLSLYIVFTHKDQVTNLGWIYILLEISIILILVFFELKTAKQLV